MAKKTVPVEFIKERVNVMLASPFTTPEQRLGAFGVLEAALFETGNYKGFAYMPSEFTEPGVLRPDYDDTRRQYS
jgi:hypothetical protein